MDNTFDKAGARKHFLAKRADMTDAERADASLRLCEEILSLEQFASADVVLVYYPTKNEPDLLPVANAALALGKRVAFPISNTADLTLTFGEITSIDQLHTGAYGIPEPEANLPKLTKNSLCIVPALAADKQGFRLGYGKGYYDRFLADFDGASVCALPDAHLCDKLPTESTDIPVDIIITQTGVIYTK